MASRSAIERTEYLLGDGTPGGMRTKRTDFPAMLNAAGFADWNCLEKLWEVKAVFDRVLDASRVLISAEGFNKVGGLSESLIQTPIAPPRV